MTTATKEKPKITKLRRLSDLVRGRFRGRDIAVKIEFKEGDCSIDNVETIKLSGDAWAYLNENGRQLVFAQPGGDYGLINVYVDRENTRVTRKGKLIASGIVCFTTDKSGGSYPHFEEQCKLLDRLGFKRSLLHEGGGP